MANQTTEYDAEIDLYEDDNWNDLFAAIRPPLGGAEGGVTRRDALALAIDWPPEGKERFRRVTKRSNARSTGKLPLRKTGRMVQWESKLERDAFLLFDGCPAIERFAEQPARIRVQNEATELWHVPDALVCLRGRSVFVEIKEEQEAASDELQERTRLVTPTLAARGFGYAVLTEAVIRKAPRLANVDYIRRFAVGEVDHASREMVRRWFNAAGGTRCWGEIKRQIANTDFLAAIARLIWEGAVWAPLHEQWDAETEFVGRV
jgi:hypothetical protein